MFLQAADLAFHVKIEGAPGGPPVLLLHSLGTDLRVWDPQVDALSKAFKIIRMDLRGHGLSDVTQGPYTIESMAGDVLSVLDRLDISRCHLAGLSLGGMIAQAAAALAPDRFDSLILCDTAMAIPPADLWNERAAKVRAHGMDAIANAVIARWVTAGFVNEPEAGGLRKMLLRTAPEGYAGAAEAIATVDLSAQTRTLRVLTLVLVGEYDEATPSRDAEALANSIPGARLETIPNAAHIPTFEQAEAVSGAMLRFLTTA